ncbi:MAG: HupE/UreJ family protein [Inquilinaceae bacterium]
MTARPSLTLIAAAATLLIAAPASAHTGTGQAGGFVSGLLHPVLGADHLIALLAFGALAGARAVRLAWPPMAVFLIAMGAGAVTAVAGLAVPLAEPGIAVSVIVFGGLLTFGTRLPGPTLACVGAVFALAHGYAHGGEIPGGAAPVAFGAGFLLATAGLLAAGAALAVAARALRPRALRLAGLAATVFGATALVGLA